MNRIRQVWRTPGAKAMVAFLVVMIAIIIAMWPRGTGSSDSDGWNTPTGGTSGEQVSAQMLDQARTDAALAPCPTSTTPAPAGDVLAGVTGSCLSNGSTVDVGAALAGRPAVINLWAVWCLPCRRELPHFQELSDRAGGALNVLAVHAADGANRPYAILQFLKEVGVHLPTVADVDGTVAQAVKAPRVYPSTVFLRADGTVAAVLPQVFDSYDELAAAVTHNLGVTVGSGS
ncbi:MAG: TlpA disulfide reductase family protein [Gordonia sp. (in: high G+C Gram-positive bacteria)]|uniref:TlpA family protein disulfide reductase n=1 Tax=Gordonia sp. (in: high G+C Gram-positive bacteria) TaxID=84139 RepID=UPI0039E5AF44